MYSAMAEEPTKPIALTRGSVSSVSTATLSPLTTLSTPAGSPAATSSSASRIGTDGSRSDGLRMKALPQASAGANFHIGIMAGKLNGVMPAATPSGWRIENRSIPGPALSLNSPLSRCGMPQANSTTSSPRWMSPLESGTILPCSEERSLARPSNSFCTSSRNLNSTRARRCGLVAAHAGCAASASAIAFSTSDLAAKATLACTSPVLGLNTSPLRPEAPATSLPPMKWPISRITASLGYALALGAVLPCQIAQLAPSGKEARGLSGARHRREVLIEPRKGLLAALDCAELDRRRTCLRGREHRPQRHLGSVPRRFECHGALEAVVAFVVTVIVDEALRLDDLPIDDPVGIVRAVGSVHDEPPDSADSHVHLVDRGGEADRPPPFCDLIGLGPRAPHQFARRVGDALDHDFPIRSLRVISGHAVFLSSRWSAACANGHRDGRSALPRACGRRRANRRRLSI